MSKTEKKFNLREKRKRYFQMALRKLKGRDLDAQGVRDLLLMIEGHINNHDKEFIKKEWKLILKYASGKITLEEFIEKRNKLIGEKLV